MKTYIMHIMAIAIAMPLLASAADKSTGWGDFKLYLLS